MARSFELGQIWTILMLRMITWFYHTFNISKSSVKLWNLYLVSPWTGFYCLFPSVFITIFQTDHIKPFFFFHRGELFFKKRERKNLCVLHLKGSSGLFLLWLLFFLFFEFFFCECFSLVIFKGNKDVWQVIVSAFFPIFIVVLASSHLHWGVWHLFVSNWWFLENGYRFTQLVLSLVKSFK